MARKRLITRANFAALAEVTKAAITKACKNGLAEACDGDQIDLSHPATQAYLKKHNVKLEPLKGPLPSAASPDDRDSVGAEYEWAVEECGSIQNYHTTLKARRAKADAQSAEFRTLTQQGRLLSKEKVRQHMFGAFEQLSLRLLDDTSVSLAAKVSMLAKAGGTTEELEALTRRILSEEMTAAKRLIVSGIRASRTEENAPEVKGETADEDDD